MKHLVSFCLVFVACSCVAQNTPIMKQDAEALANLYQHTNGAKWKDPLLGFFKNGTAYCSSPNIVCVPPNNHVSHIDFSANGLTGSLPVNFFSSFFELTQVALHDNLLQGSIPLPSKTINNYFMENNNFTGTIPTDFWQRSLEQVQIFQANTDKTKFPGLTGKLEGMSGSKILGQLYVGGHPLTGAIPERVCTLTTFDAPNCNFESIPTCIGGSTINSLTLSSNPKLTGTIDSSWCTNMGWQVIALDSLPGLTGVLPDCFEESQSTQWSTFSIVSSGVHLTHFYDMFFNLQGIHSIALSNVKGTIPANGWENEALSNLHNFQLDGSSLIGTVPEQLVNGAVDLHTLGFTNTGLNGTLPSLANLRNLEYFAVLNCPTLGGKFPTELLSMVWNEYPVGWNIPGYKPQPHRRHFQISNAAFDSFLPDLPAGQRPVFMTPNGVILNQNPWRGYVPDSFKEWVPNASQPSLFYGCDHLYRPIPKDQAAYFEENFHGFLMTPQGITPTDLPWGQEDQLITINGDNFINLVSADLAAKGAKVICGFCIPADDRKVSTQCGDAEDFVNRSTATWLPYSASKMKRENTKSEGEYQCAIPSSLTKTYNNVFIGLIYFGPAQESDSFQYHLLSLGGDESATFTLYDPNPKVYSVTPEAGRLEGCTAVTVHGAGFKNAPEDKITVVVNPKGSVEAGTKIVVQGPAVTIVDDETLTLELPFADQSLAAEGVYSTKYNFTTQREGYEVNVFPGGINSTIDTVTAGVSNASYRFRISCDQPLVACDTALGAHDTEQCSVQVCRCHGAGTCIAHEYIVGPDGSLESFVSAAASSSAAGMVPSGSSEDSFEGSGFTRSPPTPVPPPTPSPKPTEIETIFQCGCLGGFTGGQCDRCKDGFFGSQCSPCQCNPSGGLCDQGINGTGACDCFKSYIGKTCAINWHYLVIFIPLALIILAVVVCTCWCRRRMKAADAEPLLN